MAKFDLRLSMDVLGEKVLDRAFLDVGAIVEKPARLLEEAYNDWFSEAVNEQFASEGAAGPAGHYPALSKRYAEQKARAGFGGKPILQREGLLLTSLTRKGAKFAVRQLTDDTITRGTTRPGARAHHTGTGQKMRKVLDPSEGRTRDLVKRVQREVLVPLRRTGLEVTA